MPDPAAASVRSHYETVGELYRAAWGDSMHFAVFSGDEPRPEAVAATERMLADEGEFGPLTSVLDVGCGTGGPALSIAGYSGAHVTGIDLVPRQIKRARERAAECGLADRTHFEVADATQLPMPDETFDRVYAIESAYHAADKPRFYAECARVLRPGGLMLGTDWLRRGGDGDQPYLDAVRDQFAIPELLTLGELRHHLASAGLVPEVVEDLRARGRVERNWEPLGAGTWPRLVRASRTADPSASRTFAAGSQALAAAADAGAFVLGHFVARKP
jgi:ubiquinone/menaquinone biosynthesis C-methylase UbiE